MKDSNPAWRLTRSLSKPEKCIFWTLCFLLLVSLLLSAYYTLEYGGYDLRIRVIGARLLETDSSPYFFKWSPGISERLLDPMDDPALAYNGVTAAPGLLFFQSLFNSLQYPAIRMLWTILQYVMIGYIFFYFIAKHKAQGHAKHWMIGITALFFLCSPIWFINIERGQIYILFPLLFCLIYQLISSEKHSAYFLAGILILIGAYCRPPFILAGLPFLLFMNKRVLMGMVTGGIVLSVHALINADLWSDYFSSMQLWNGLASSASISPASSSLDYPPIIEGASNLNTHKYDFKTGGLKPLSYWGDQVFPGMNRALYVVAYLVTALVLIIKFKKRAADIDARSLVLFGFMLYILSEYFIPAPRGHYNTIQWVLPVFLMLGSGKMKSEEIVLLVVGLCLTVSFPFHFPYFYDIGEILVFGTLYLFLFSKRKKVEKFTSPSPVLT